MRWLPKTLKDHLEARAAKIEQEIDAPSVDPEKIEAAIARMKSARESLPETPPRPAPAAPAAPAATPPRTGFGRRGL